MNFSQSAPEGERLSKRVMQLRSCSRREAEQYIEGGFVRVDGTVVEEPQFRVKQQAVTMDAHASLLNLTPITLIINKPVGFSDGLEASCRQKRTAKRAHFAHACPAQRS
jgi:23S rRNA pseudouridine2604 synthase